MFLKLLILSLAHENDLLHEQLADELRKNAEAARLYQSARLEEKLTTQAELTYILEDIRERKCSNWSTELTAARWKR